MRPNVSETFVLSFQARYVRSIACLRLARRLSTTVQRGIGCRAVALRIRLLPAQRVAKYRLPRESIGGSFMTLPPPEERVAAPDREDIVRVVQLYIDGFNDCTGG
jgi:hypothetical protein